MWAFKHALMSLFSLTKEKAKKISDLFKEKMKEYFIFKNWIKYLKKRNLFFLEYNMQIIKYIKIERIFNFFFEIICDGIYF